MAQGDPPVYDLSDPDGNTVAEIRHDLAEKMLVEVLDGNEIDFQQSDLSNIASVSTESTQYDVLAEGASSDTESVQLSSNERVVERVQRSSVDSSATAIWDYNRAAGALVHVSGRGSDSVGAYFSDVLTIAFNQITVIDSAERNTPAARSYTHDGVNSRLELAMDSESYRVTAVGHRADQPATI